MPYIGVKCADIKADESPGAKILPTPRVPTGLNELLKLDPVPLSLGKLPVFMHY